MISRCRSSYPVPPLWAWLLVLAPMLVAGCAPEPDIRQYTIDTTKPPELTIEHRMLGAIVPHGSEAYFYKLVGPANHVEQVADQVRAWVPTVQYGGDRPEWIVPEDWTLRWGGSNAFDVAKFDLPAGEPPLELKVTKLGTSDSWPEFVRLNVNRWRGQMGLAPSEEEMAGAVPLAGVASADQGPEPRAMWVDITGQFGGGPAAGGPMMGGPMMGGSAAGGSATDGAGASGPDRGGASASGAAAGSPDAAEEPLTYETPEGWREGVLSAMRMAAFEMGPEGRTAQLTVIPAGGDIRGNVDRWMKQVITDGVDDEAVDAVMDAAREVTVDGRESQRFVIIGSGENPQAIDATIVPLDDGLSLFIKMTGDAKTVAAESDNIAQFLDSLKLNL